MEDPARISSKHKDKDKEELAECKAAKAQDLLEEELLAALKAGIKEKKRKQNRKIKGERNGKVKQG